MWNLTVNTIKKYTIKNCPNTSGQALAVIISALCFFKPHSFINHICCVNTGIKDASKKPDGESVEKKTPETLVVMSHPGYKDVFNLLVLPKPEKRCLATDYSGFWAAVFCFDHFELFAVRFYTLKNPKEEVVLLNNPWKDTGRDVPSSPSPGPSCNGPAVQSGSEDVFFLPLPHWLPPPPEPGRQKWKKNNSFSELRNTFKRPGRVSACRNRRERIY